jgi:hypothetical protein
MKSHDVESLFGNTLQRITRDIRKDSELPVPELPPSEAVNWRSVDTLDIEQLESNQQIDRWLNQFNEDGLLRDPQPDPLIEGSIRATGLDALAFYKSYRDRDQSPIPGKWGIFYLESGIAALSKVIRRRFPGCTNSPVLARQWLLAHEFFHYKFDLYSLMLEGAIGRELWSPLHRAYRNHTTHLVEEALANRDTAAWASKVKSLPGFGKFIRDEMARQPHAYRRFGEPVVELQAELAANLLDLNVARTARRYDQARYVGEVPWLSTSLRALRDGVCCPEYVIYDSGPASFLKPAWAIRRVQEVVDSPKVVKALEGFGATMRKKWEQTKGKLISSPDLPGLDFKFFRRDPDQWSVRIDDNFRAHLSEPTHNSGIWETVELGPHKAMGHG